MCTEVVLWSTFALQSKTFQKNVGENTTSAYFKLVLNLKLVRISFFCLSDPLHPNWIHTARVKALERKANISTKKLIGTVRVSLNLSNKQ